MKRKKKNIQEAGFTLIELLIVASLLAVIGVTLYSTFVNGISIWRRITEETALEDANIFLDKISRDLRNSFQLAGITLRGSTDEISIPAIFQSSEKGRPRKEIGQVKYSLSRKEGVAYREYQTYSQLYSKKGSSKDVAAGGVQSLSFRYYYYDLKQKQYFWTDSWQETEQKLGAKEPEILPVAVRVELGLNEGVNMKEVTRTVSVPSGCCIAEDTEDEPQAE